MVDRFEVCLFYSIFSDLPLSFYLPWESSVSFSSVFFLLLRFSSQLELDKKELVVEEVEIELLLIRFLLFAFISYALYFRCIFLVYKFAVFDQCFWSLFQYQP